MKNVIAFIAATTFVLLPFAKGASGQSSAGASRMTCPAGINGVDECPPQGCGGGDGELNKGKNRTDSPSAGQIKPMTIAAIARLAQPKNWTTNAPRVPLKKLGEGTAVVVTGFLEIVKHEGKESCNCELSGVSNTDLHMAIVQRKTDKEESSITAEITPRVRNHKHPEWTIGPIAEFQGKPIRITGWLLLDTEHLKRPLKRATNWEIHPVTDFEGCDDATPADCDKNNSWRRIKNN